MLRFTNNIIGQMTLQCNLNCKYCYEGRDVKKTSKIMTVPDFKEALDSYLYHHCVLGKLDRLSNWHFHGGEPLLYNWDDFVECVNYIERRKELFPGLTWCIQTNGTLLTDEMAKFFAEKNITVGFSFDGFGDTERMSAKENNELIERLSRFHNEYGTLFSCLCVLSRKNMKTWLADIKSISSWCPNCGINLLCGTEEVDNDIPSGEECWEYWVKPCLESYLTDNPVKERLISIMLENYLITDILLTNQTGPYKTGCFDRACGHGVNMTSIDPDMVASDCDKFLEESEHIDLRVKHPLNERDFLGLQQVNRYVKFLQELFKIETETGCDNCYAKYICIGDCQSVNLSRYGELRINKDMCQVYKNSYDFLKLHWMEILSKHKVRSIFDIKGFTSTALREMDDFGYSPIIDEENNIYLEKK